MTFNSILFANGSTDKLESSDQPDFFIDLNLDQIINTINAGREGYNLKPFFYTPLNNLDDIQYRQEVMIDIEDRVLFNHIKEFTYQMRSMRERIDQSNKLHYKYQKKGLFVDIIGIYCTAVNNLLNGLSSSNLKSSGLIKFRNYLMNYVNSEIFISLVSETEKVKANLSTIRYCILINGSTIKVRRYESEIDYSVCVENTFDHFKKGAVKDYRVNFPDYLDMNHIEAKILDFVVDLYPNIFADLDIYCITNANYLNTIVDRFDREINFYISYLEYILPLKRAGLIFCYPKISNSNKEIYVNDGFDLALAHKLVNENLPVVCNDFYLKNKERIFIVSGPNQGGKTTFARSFGQLHYLACLGCPVPGRNAQLFLFDRLFTHFEKAENNENFRGKLQDDLIRIHSILNKVTPFSVVIINEIFTSTTLSDAICLAKKIIMRIIELDCFCVCVTFLDELSLLGEKTVSLVSTIAPENPTIRTFKILRKSADGLSYALSIAEKYHLTYDMLKMRVKI